MINIRETLAGMLSLPNEIALNLPMVIITGRGEANIENYKNIVEYTVIMVRVNTTSGQLAVEGKGLSLKQITSENIIVSGEIAALRFI